MNISNIRNFAIIAHIDHGKSTLADRLMELTGVIKPGQHDEQFLDRNPISRERGITIKLAPVSMMYKSNNLEGKMKNNNIITNNNKKYFGVKSAKNTKNPGILDFDIENLPNSSYLLNLVDTPGHVDFSYEVERTLACVEGAILLVDATQGIQAQTIAHAYKAIEQNLAIIPAINKIDRSDAEIEKTKLSLARFLGINQDLVHEISAKNGTGCEELLSTIVEQIPNPGQKSLDIRQKTIDKNEKAHNNLQALIFDSYYDSHQGVVAFVRIFCGEVRAGDKIMLCQSQEYTEVQEVGIFTPDLTEQQSIEVGQIGYIKTKIKNIKKVSVGDTVTKDSETKPLPGYRKIKPMLQASLFPTNSEDFPKLEKAMEKMYLTDSALEYRQIYSQALGPGFVVGFLGLLHAEIVKERLEREHNQDLILTPARVKYKLHNSQYLEPFAKVSIITPTQYMGKLIQLTQSYRAKLIQTIDIKIDQQVMMEYEFPLGELMSNFFDRLNSLSSGFASLDWELIDYRPVKAGKLEILINGIEVEELSQIIDKFRATEIAKSYVERLGKLIPRQQYEVRIQAQFKNKIIASSRISPLRKNVTAKLYGGDRTRKDKLLKQQKKGKKQLKAIGKVNIPQETFTKLFKSEFK